METYYCNECGAYQELRTFGYGEIYPECENCGAYLEYQERNNETETKATTERD